MSPPSPFVCCLSVCVCVCTCACIHFFERVKAMCNVCVKPLCYSHADQPHKPLHRGFHMDLLWSSTSRQNPLVQCCWLTGHQRLSVDTMLTGCCGCWLGWWLEGPVYSGCIRAVKKYLFEVSRNGFTIIHNFSMASHAKWFHTILTYSDGLVSCYRLSRSLQIE